MDMKLSKFLYSKLTEGDGEPVFSVDTLDEWIAEWQHEIYDRAPPVWLSGPRCCLLYTSHAGDEMH